MHRRDRLGLVGRAVRLRHAHAPEPEGGDLRALAQPSSFHGPNVPVTGGVVGETARHGCRLLRPPRPVHQLHAEEVAGDIEHPGPGRHLRWRSCGRNGVTVDAIRAVDHDIATGVWPDMTEHGWERDEWPAIFEQVMAADILVLCTPIWLGEKSSVCTQVIERLYGNSSPAQRRTASTPTTGGSAAASSPATRTA